MPPSKTVIAPVFLALLLTISAGTVALFAQARASDYLANLNTVDPELAQHPPFLGYAPPRSTRRVILIIVDGLRLKDSFISPTLNALRRQGVDSIAYSHYPSISRPNHTSLITGVPPLLSGVRNNSYWDPVKIDSIMDRLQAEDRQSTFIADVSPSLAYLFGDDFAALYYGNWPGGFSKSTQLALSQQNSDFIVLIPGRVDTIGHRNGGDSPQYREAVLTVDQQISNALKDIDLSQDTLIVTSDHGHTDAGGHGGEEPEVMRVPLILAGAGINRNALLGKASLIDLAPTICALLGIPAPGHAVGRTLVEVLPLPQTSITSLQESDRLRIARNEGIYQESLQAARERKHRHQRKRLLFLAGFFILVMAALFIAKRFGALHIDWRVLVIAVPAYPLCYYGLLEVLGQSLSFSAIKDKGSEMSNLMQFGLISTVVQLIAGWLALRNRVILRDRLAAANALVLCGLLVAWLPAGLLWALHGPSPHVEIPSSTIALLIPANYIAAATYAVGATLLLLLEIIVFFARAVDPRVRLQKLERAAQKQRAEIESEMSSSSAEP